MGKRKFARDPLLYIHQPSIQTPEAHMQHNYASPKETPVQGQQAEQAVSQTEPRAAVKRSSYFKRELPESESNNKSSTTYRGGYESDESDESPYNPREAVSDLDNNNDEKKGTENRKKFKDMTLEEKVSYFTDVPENAPRVKCEIKTEDQTFRGIIVDSKDGDVFMRVGRRTSATKIPFDSITDIRLLGF